MPTISVVSAWAWAAPVSSLAAGSWLIRYACIHSAERGGSGGCDGSNQIITSAPIYFVCQTAVDIIQLSESANPKFHNVDNAQVSSCLCYSNSNWAPQEFDQP